MTESKTSVAARMLWAALLVIIIAAPWFVAAGIIVYLISVLAQHS